MSTKGKFGGGKTFEETVTTMTITGTVSPHLLEPGRQRVPATPPEPTHSMLITSPEAVTGYTHFTEEKAEA